MSALWLPEGLGALASPVDASPDGKALELTSASQYVTIPNAAPFADLTAFTLIVLYRPASHAGGEAIVAKSEDNNPANGWAFLNRTDGGLWLRAGRATTQLQYISTDTPLEPVNALPLLLVVTFDQSAGNGAKVIFEYARVHGHRIGRLITAALTTTTEGAGAFTVDNGQPLRIGNTANGTTGATGRHGLTAIYPLLTAAQRRDVVADLLASRRWAHGFWRPGHRGMGRVEDESGNGNSGTITGTPRARTFIRDLWQRPETPAKATPAPQTVTLGAAAATGTANDAAVTLGGLVVALAVAIATSPVPEGNVNIAVSLGGITVPLTPAIGNQFTDGIFTIGVTLGGLTASLGTAIGTGTAEDISVTSGSAPQTVQLTEAIATGTARDINVVTSDLSSRIESKPALIARPYGRRDASLDGKAWRATATGDRINFGTPSSLNDRASFTAIVIYRPSALALGKGVLSKRMAGGSTNGWALELRAGGELWVRWARPTTALSYITDEVIAQIGVYSVVAMTLDQAAPAGALVELEYARWGAAPRSATFGTATDGAGAFATDAAQNLRLGAYSNSGVDAALGDYVFVGIWPRLSRDERLRLVADLTLGRSTALLWARPGQRGQTFVEDESGNAINGTLSGGQAVSSIRNLWQREWMAAAIGGRPSQLVTLGAAAATALAKDVNAQFAQTVALSPAIATAIADNLVGFPFWLLRERDEQLDLEEHRRRWAMRVRHRLFDAPEIDFSAVGFAQATSQTVALSPAVATATVPAPTVTQGILVPVGEAVAIAVAKDVAASLGSEVVALSPAIATAIARDGVVVQGGLIVALSPAIGTGTVPDATAVLGGLTVALTPATATAIAELLQALFGTGITLDPAIATASAQDVNAALGGLLVGLTPAQASGVVLDVSVTVGGIVVALSPAQAAAVAQLVTTGAGQIVGLGEAIANAVAPPPSTTLGPLVVQLPPAIAQAISQGVLTLLGGTSATLGVATATGFARDMVVVVVAPSRLEITVEIYPAVRVKLELEK